MNIVTFCSVDEKLFDTQQHKIASFDESISEKADIAILDINSIFDFEENKNKACKEKFVSIAVVDDKNDYDAFKNFGIDAWINGEDIKDINEIINLVEKRFLS